MKMEGDGETDFSPMLDLANCVLNVLSKWL